MLLVHLCSSGFHVISISEHLALFCFGWINDELHRAQQLYVCPLRQSHNKDSDIFCAVVLFVLSVQCPVLYTVYMNRGQEVESVLKLR